MKRSLRITVSIFVQIACTIVIHAQYSSLENRIKSDGICSYVEAGTVTYKVVSNVGMSTEENIKMAPRLETLEGKTIAIVGEDFMCHITHPALGRLLTEHYPTPKVIMYDTLPIAGPYPAPGIMRSSTEQFRQRLIDLKVDAVIAGNGGCGGFIQQHEI